MLRDLLVGDKTCEMTWKRYNQVKIVHLLNNSKELLATFQLLGWVNTLKMKQDEGTLKLSNIFAGADRGQTIFLNLQRVLTLP